MFPSLASLACASSPLVKVLAAKSDDLSSIPRTHVVKGENQLLQVVSDLHMCSKAGNSPSPAAQNTRAHTANQTENSQGIAGGSIELNRQKGLHWEAS